MKQDIKHFRINDMKPFLTHQDAANERLQEAHALSVLLGDILLADDEVFATLNPNLQQSVVRSITSLIAYAQFHLAAAEAEEG